ncbi:phosphodiester glycosidase family protein [Spongiactinospora sp. TRM90649]|uniref:phosphodiester glycosidase family protein n=1 Tax=Spongiactinospora sp. TRM90649 TaxID=3031114 RepID=UPI0023F961B0|nr:phosphodiester glycosidase family protein [Spongiactinospora sp. TRM90649]MDF5753933.1 phosphodiester glycosidase family protein [Spongiactinospora sp. TRM90649]
MTRRFIVGLSAATVLVVAAVPAASAAPVSASFPGGRFPLGLQGVPARDRAAVAPGIDLFKIRYGKATEGWAVTVLMPNGRDHGTQADADAKAIEVQEAGESPSVLRFIRPGVADDPEREYFAVRVGVWPFKQRAKADKMVAKLKKAGVRAKTDYLGDDGFDTTGPWNMNVLMVNGRTFRGNYVASVGKSVAKRETTSAMSKQVKAIAGVNGGFFNIHTPKNLQGDPMGVSVVGGKLLSEAVPGRSALILNGRSARITELKTQLTAVGSDGANEVQGINRAAGAGELVAYTEEFGQKTPANGGSEAVVDLATGTVVKVRQAGGAVPRGTWVLHGSGDSAAWINEHAWAEWKLSLETKVIDLRTGKAVPLTPQTHIIGGSVGLVRNGNINITAKANGHASVNMILRRHPRTMAGVTRSGGLVLATVDGRRPGETVGASMVEAAQLMRWLGAKNAINLDGGGSTAMVVRHRVVNRPSDGRERTVGDGLYITR